LKKLLFVLPVSSKIGLGHFSRCSVLSSKFPTKLFKTFLLNTEKYKNLQIFKRYFNEYLDVKFKINNKNLNNFFKIHKIIKPDYIIIDSPDINSNFRKKLTKKKILWLEFANGKKNLKLPSQVINPIPNYKKNLSSKNKNISYVGHEYSLLRKEFFKKITFKKNNDKKSKIFMCFGGGNDKGLYKFILDIMIKFQNLIKEINIICYDPAVNKKLNSYIINFNKIKKNFIKIHFRPLNFVNIIDKSTLIFVTGGGITHEINCRMKKMNIISISNNQVLQSRRWENFGHNYVGSFKKKNESYLKNRIIKIFEEKNKIIYIKKNIFKDRTNEIIHDTVKIIK
jgi:spore coat polysaccharide biosynthesis predicted glycosyltransferase SpsG